MRYRHSQGSWQANVFNLVFRALLFLALVTTAVIIYLYLFVQVLNFKFVHIWAFVAIWIITAYIVLPYVNRFLSRIYLPSYFIGRARTGDGLLGDPINLAIRGSKKQLIQAMEQSGWLLAEPLTFKSSLKMISASVRGKRYATAPVSSLFLFQNKQDLAFEREIGGNPRKRHHVRFWKTPTDWWLPGGYQVDWLGAATYDKHVGLSVYTGQITHKIDADVDVERNFVVNTLRESGAAKKIDVVEHFTTSYHSRNGGGDRIHTDGALRFIDL